MQRLSYSRVRIAVLHSTPLVALLALAIVCWWAAGAIFHVPDFLVSSPRGVLDVFLEQPRLLLNHLFVTLRESVVGFLLANSIAFFLALVLAEWRFAERAIYPLAIALKTAPIVALAPLLVVWFGSGLLSKVISAAIVCFFPMLVNAVRGLKEVDPDAVDLFISLGAERVTILRKLRIPNSLPYIFSALKISTSLSVVGAIVGEFVGAQAGLGYLVVVSSYHLETAMLAAAVISSGFIGVIMFSLVAVAEHYLVPWDADILR